MVGPVREPSRPCNSRRYGCRTLYGRCAWGCVGKTMKRPGWRHVIAWARYNLLTFPVIAAIYIPYNVFWIGYTPVQILKWLATSALFAAGANLILQPWVTFIHRRGWVK